MQLNEIDAEIEKLRLKKVELTNRMNLLTDFDDKEELVQQVKRLQRQIEMLEKFKKK